MVSDFSRYFESIYIQCILHFKGKGIPDVSVECMSFLECSNLEAKSITHFRLCYQRDKRSNYDLQQAKCRRGSFFCVFYTPENKIIEKFRLKVKLTGTKV